MKIINKFSDYIKNHRYETLIFIILIVGFLARTIGIVNHPNGFNTDEASIGYEAFSIVNFGMDRNGKTYPVFLEAWGSGQNVLYMVMIIPFVKLFGLSEFTVRFPMALMGCISLLVMYKLLSKMQNKELTLIGLAFFAITPWHIMKSRYGLESNVFPDFCFYAFYFICTSFLDKKMYKFYIGAIFLGLCSYAYGTSYFFLPVFVAGILIVLLVKKEIKFRHAIIFFSIVFLISLPIMLMIAINSFDLDEMHILVFTIPKLQENRYEQLTLLSSDNIIKNLWDNFYNSSKMLLTGTDGYNANALDFYGIVYIFSLPIMIIGIIKSFRKKELFNIILNIWFVAAFLLLFVCEPNINRMNIIYFPMIFYTIIGLYGIVEKHEWSLKLIQSVYLIAFILFEITYFNTNFLETYTFMGDIKDVIKYTDTLDEDTIYFEYAIKEPYIYVLFYNEIETPEFVNTVKYRNNFKTFNSVIEFGRYKFYLPEELDEKAAYVMTKETARGYTIDSSKWKRKYIDDFCVLEKRDD